MCGYILGEIDLDKLDRADKEKIQKALLERRKELKQKVKEIEGAISAVQNSKVVAPLREVSRK
jgi:hypothetical protein